MESAPVGWAQPASLILISLFYTKKSNGFSPVCQSILRVGIALEQFVFMFKFKLNHELQAHKKHTVGIAGEKQPIAFSNSLIWNSSGRRFFHVERTVPQCFSQSYGLYGVYAASRRFIQIIPFIARNSVVQTITSFKGGPDSGTNQLDGCEYFGFRKGICMVGLYTVGNHLMYRK